MTDLDTLPAQQLALIPGPGSPLPRALPPLDPLASLTARARLLTRALPSDMVVGRKSAAWIWGLDVLPPDVTPDTWPVELLIPPGRRPPAVPGVSLHASHVPRSEVTEHEGVRVTTMERTALDCARWPPWVEAVAALDRFLRAGVDSDALQARAALLAGRPNVRQLRDVLAAGDSGAESPGESWTRAVIIAAGIPRPRTQIKIRGPEGHTYRIDMGDPDRRVGAEYDGEEHHTRPHDTSRDRRRQAWLEDQGWKLVRVTKQDALVEPRPFLAAYLEALRRQGWKPTDDQLCTILARITLSPSRLYRPPSASWTP